MWAEMMANLIEYLTGQAEIREQLESVDRRLSAVEDGLADIRALAREAYLDQMNAHPEPQ